MSLLNVQRRIFLRTGLGCTVATGTMILARQTNTFAAVNGKACNDLSALSPADIKMRESVNYVLPSQNTGQRCGNCQHLQPTPRDPGPCYACSIVPGPINRKARCDRWVERLSSAG